MREFISGFNAFLDIQIVLVAEFYEVIHGLEEAKKIGLTSLWLVCDYALVCVAFTRFLVIDGTLALIIVGKSRLGFLTFFVKEMYALTNLLTWDLFIENNFIGIIGFHLVFSQNYLLIGIDYRNIAFLMIFIYGFWSSLPYLLVFPFFLSFFFFNILLSCGGRWLLILDVST